MNPASNKTARALQIPFANKQMMSVLMAALMFILPSGTSAWNSSSISFLDPPETEFDFSYSPRDDVYTSAKTVPDYLTVIQATTPTVKPKSRTLNLTTGDIIQCLLVNGTLVSTADEGSIVFDGIVKGTESMYSCQIRLVAAAGLVVRLWDLHKPNCGVLSIVITDTGVNRILFKESCIAQSYSEMFSLSESVVIRLVSDKKLKTEAGLLLLRFAAVPSSERPKLELRFTSPTAGYLQTPGWENEKSTYPPLMNSSVDLRVPANHSVMISFEALTLTSCSAYDENFAFLEIRNGSGKRMTTICGFSTPSQTVYHIPVVKFHFTSGSDRQAGRGFRMRFSFHEREDLPEKLNDGRWNCSSVKDWSPYQQHFPCNLSSECLDMKDESVCPYTTEECGPGFFAAGNSCLTFSAASSQVWDDANMLCTSRGLKAAALQNVDKIVAVSNVLERGQWPLAGPLFFTSLRGLSNLPYMYRDAYVWSDGTVVFVDVEKVASKNEQAQCTLWYPKTHDVMPQTCEKTSPQTYVLCEKDKVSDLKSHQQTPEISAPTNTMSTKLSLSLVDCPLQHVTHRFLACDPSSACWAKGYDPQTCVVPFQTPPPSYRCDSQMEHVPYTLVCDHRADCRDNSDEDFCHFDPCGSDRPFDCGNGQCILSSQKCNGQQDCTNEADEFCVSTSINKTFRLSWVMSGDVTLNYQGKLTLKPFSINQNSTNPPCNDTHFRCPQSDVTYCLPVFLRCNGLYDCPGHGDEAACDSYTCPGFYRCRNSRVCVHPTHLCDGLYQCPQHDDELLCDLTCPDPCVCHGLAFFCSRPFLAHKFPRLRFLDASGTGMTPADVKNNRLLIHLALAACNLTQLGQWSLPNLRSLDLTNNLISALSENDFKKITNLKEINLAGNPLSSFLTIKAAWSSAFSSLIRLDISNIVMQEVYISNIYCLFPNLQFLNMSSCNIDRILGDGFKSLTSLRTLDVRGCSLTEFGPDILSELHSLESVDADNYKLCCPANLPTGFNPGNCRAPADHTSSCDNLLSLTLYRIFLSVTAFLALMGNAASLTYRIFFLKMNSNLGFDIFVTNLCLSDFLMGVYLAIIGITDRVYMGVYLWKDLEWKRSAMCQMAGFLAFLSTEVSAFIISLITLDRFLVLHFPFRRFYFSKRSALVASGVAWTVGATIAAVPLIPAMSHWKFYGQSGICIPLPINPSNDDGHGYSFGVIIVLNFVLFLVVAVGQAFIFWSVRTNTMSACDTSKKNKNLTVARRLISVAVCNFVCWFPIGLLGLMASSGVVVSEEVNVAMAIFVLPINSALNPFLYTVNLLLERRKRAQELRLMEKIKRDLQTSVVSTRYTSSKR